MIPFSSSSFLECPVQWKEEERLHWKKTSRLNLPQGKAKDSFSSFPPFPSLFFKKSGWESEMRFETKAEKEKGERRFPPTSPFQLSLSLSSQLATVGIKGGSQKGCKVAGMGEFPWEGEEGTFIYGFLLLLFLPHFVSPPLPGMQYSSAEVGLPHTQCAVALFFSGVRFSDFRNSHFCHCGGGGGK